MDRSFIKTESESDFGDELLRICSTKQKKAEVEAFIRIHGYSLSQACEVVCLSEEEFLRSPPVPQSRIRYLPTPSQIQRLCWHLLDARDADDGRASQKCSPT